MTAADIKECPDCGGEGRIGILWSEGYHPGAPKHLAGEVHHYEDCETCGGDGEIEEEDGEWT